LGSGISGSKTSSATTTRRLRLDGAAVSSVVLSEPGGPAKTMESRARVAAWTTRATGGVEHDRLDEIVEPADLAFGGVELAVAGGGVVEHLDGVRKRWSSSS